ncbi:MAG: cytochrome d ubiquinol oxidase subunit II [Chlamydiia bacterium]|nr:cytochrome d ubiquinol oxidase subunit II [Chlamydiia bacterium]
MQVIWYVAFAALLIGYAVLDGFDLGVGILHLFSKKDLERRLMLNSIGPVWDGNEVWLVTAGGALFAGFPMAYATFASSFYVPVMALLGGLIFRAVAIEFRSKQPMGWWRWMWDILFALASFVIAFGLGVAVGNLIVGIPLDAQGDFTGHFTEFFHPYALLVGVMAVALFTMHGCIYLMMKTEGEFHEKIRAWVNPTIITFIMLYAVTTAATLIYFPHMVETIKQRPYIFIVAVINMFAIANIPREINVGKDMLGFLSSCLNIACLLTLYAIGMFPNIVLSSVNPEVNSITIWNGSSSLLTLHILLLIAVIGIPMVISYTAGIYYIFRGKVKLDAHSY